MNWADFSSRLMPHTATELACGLVSPLALLGGVIAFGRSLVRTIKWELGLLVLVLLLCMLPSANVFRWSFRWLPLLHLVLALCAAESLRLFAASPVPAMKRPGLIGFILTVLVIGPAWFAGANGERAVPFVWITLGLAGTWALLEIFSARTRALAPPIIASASFLATYLCIPPNCGVPKYNLAQELTQPAPLDPQRLYLSVYPAPEDAYRLEKHAEPLGTTIRPGSTSMWGGVHLINGYSPIRPSGVAREFAFAIHGEIPPEIGNRLLENESGADGLLTRIGVDGIIVANEVAMNPQPDTEWELAVTTQEGRVFHRRGGPFPVIRSVTALDSQPNEQFATAEISRIENRRNRLEADVIVPPGASPAVLTISRPFFRGYSARIGDQELRVDSYRGLNPAIEIPPGTNGRLTMVYRPGWLVLGGSVSIVCLSIMTFSGALAISGKRRSR
jgi:hypothetical protein